MFGMGYYNPGAQIAQSRSYLHTLSPKIGTICILGALGQVHVSVKASSSQKKSNRMGRFWDWWKIAI